MMLAVDKLSKSFFDGKNTRKVIDGVSFSIEDKSIVLIDGRSGCGKSTLLGMIGGILKPDGGQILFNDEKIRKKHVSFIFQEHQLLEELTGEENLNFVKRFRSIKDWKSYAKLLAIGHLLDVAVERLSGGEKQRFNILRGICTDSKVLLADEPTSHLDRNMSNVVANILSEESKNKLVLVVSHSARREDFNFDKSIYMNDGRLLKAKK
jgi:ABC-type lipoprotein export system ATPase subunit